MNSDLEVTWLKTEGESAVWETQHLFGTDLCFGYRRGRVLVPVRFTQLNSPTTLFERRRITAAFLAWVAGDWALLNVVLEDLAPRG